MTVVLEAVAGPIAGRQIEVPTGTILRIGRTKKADYVIGEDFYLSGAHFAMEWDGAECKVRDLGSSNGTFVNGARVADAVIKPGDSLAAGGSTFSILLRTEEKPSSSPTLYVPTMRFTEEPPLSERTAFQAPTPEIWPGFSRPQTVLLHRLFDAGEPVYAILDPTRDSRIASVLNSMTEPHARVDETVPASPFIAVLPPRGPLLDLVIHNGWSHQWGYFFTSNAPFANIHLHWRSYVMLRNEFGREVMFRFWDVRLLRLMLPQMQPQEAREFMGPATRIVIEGDQPQVAIEFSISASGVRQSNLMLV